VEVTKEENEIFKIFELPSLLGVGGGGGSILQRKEVLKTRLDCHR